MASNTRIPMYQERIDALHKRLDELEDHVDSKFDELVTVKSAIEQFTDMLETSNKNSAEIIVLYTNIKSFLKVLGVIKVMSEWLVKVAAAVTLLWFLFQYGVSHVIDNLRGK